MCHYAAPRHTESLIVVGFFVRRVNYETKRAQNLFHFPALKVVAVTSE